MCLPHREGMQGDLVICMFERATICGKKYEISIFGIDMFGTMEYDVFMSDLQRTDFSITIATGRLVTDGSWFGFPYRKSVGFISSKSLDRGLICSRI